VAFWAKWEGDPEKLKAALEVAGFLEETPLGLRIRGTSRYLKLSQMQRQRRAGKRPPVHRRSTAGGPPPSPSPSPSLGGEDSEAARDQEAFAGSSPATVSRAVAVNALDASDGPASDAAGESCAAETQSPKPDRGQRAPESENLKLELGAQSEKPSPRALADLWNAEAAPDLPPARTSRHGLLARGHPAHQRERLLPGLNRLAGWS